MKMQKSSKKRCAHCLKTIFPLLARMAVWRWFACIGGVITAKNGQYSSAKVHRSLRVAPKDGVRQPSCADDYVITLESLPNLEPEIIDGV